MEVVIGTYEEFVLGYNLLSRKDAEGLLFEFKLTFSDHTHINSVRCISCSPDGIVASGGTDESVNLVDLKSRAEVGTLSQHTGTVNAVKFYKDSHMFSCSTDGSVCVWKTKNWECQRTFHGHKSDVYDVDVHPSGKLALSIGKDRTMRTWNLITGRRAYITNIKAAADLIRWLPSGEQYIIVTNSIISVYNVETGTVCKTIECPNKIHTLDFSQDDHLVVGGEKGHIYIYSLDDFEQVYTFQTDTVRVKSISCVTAPAAFAECDGDRWVTTASSDGHVQLWYLFEDEGNWEHLLLAKVKNQFRNLCIATYIPAMDDLDISDTDGEGMSEEEEITASDLDRDSEDGDAEDVYSDDDYQEEVITIKSKKSKKRKSKSGLPKETDDLEEQPAKKRKSQKAIEDKDQLPPEIVATKTKKSKKNINKGTPTKKSEKKILKSKKTTKNTADEPVSTKKKTSKKKKKHVNVE